MSTPEPKKPNFNCPVCGTLSTLIIGPTQAFCTNSESCDVLCFDPSLADGGMSNPNFINLDEKTEDA